MDTLFFIASKVFWTLARPESWIVLLLLLSLLAFRRGRNRFGQRTLTASLAFLLAVGMLPIGEILLRPLETRFPRDPHVIDPAGIIVLGGGEIASVSAASGLAEINEAGDRFIAALALAERFPEARVIFSGGSGALFDHDLSGADVAELVFREAGLNDDRLLFERFSRNTAENAALTHDLVAPAGQGPWLLVTSAFHMPRALGSFCAAGWENVVPYPVDFRAAGGGQVRWDLAGRLALLNISIKEWIGLLAYRATGRTSRLLGETC